MQARLFISSALLLCSFARSSFACGPEAPVQPAPVPDIALVSGETSHVVKLNGDIAKTIFKHLNGPFIKVTKRRHIEQRVGVGITCVGNKRTDVYSCQETVLNPYKKTPEWTVTGEVAFNFEATQEMKQNPDWIELQLFSPDLKTLYDAYGKSRSKDELGEVNKYTKKGSGLTCIWLENIETGTNTYACTQYLSTDGYPIGDGNDPIIGSGTHPKEQAGVGEMP